MPDQIRAPPSHARGTLAAPVWANKLLGNHKSLDRSGYGRAGRLLRCARNDTEGCHCEEPFDFAQDKLRDEAISTCTIEMFSGTGDRNCLAGASTGYGPAALIRGGFFLSGAEAGVFNVDGGFQPSVVFAGGIVGFRCGR